MENAHRHTKGNLLNSTDGIYDDYVVLHLHNANCISALPICFSSSILTWFVVHIKSPFAVAVFPKKLVRQTYEWLNTIWRPNHSVPCYTKIENRRINKASARSARARARTFHRCDKKRETPIRIFFRSHMCANKYLCIVDCFGISVKITFFSMGLNILVPLVLVYWECLNWKQQHQQW